ncbi:MAG TPA: 2-C-methyl-D-erythritol 2,4-cyclodiphosphate synthase, partial [Dehalococcoidia bacterium]
FEGGLEGHSDGDVLLHAIVDALLGAAALGDIGGMFPSSDERWRGADGRALLELAARRIREAGFEPVNVDATVVAGRPRLAPYVADMREAVATTLGMGVDRVSIKATTTDGLGFTGQGEGIAAFASVLIE